MQWHYRSQKVWYKFVKNWQKIIQSHWYYYIGYSSQKKIDDCENIYSVNPLYLRIDHANGYIEEKNGNNYLIFYSVDKNKKLLKRLQIYLEWN